MGSTYGRVLRSALNAVPTSAWRIALAAAAAVTLISAVQLRVTVLL